MLVNLDPSTRRLVQGAQGGMGGLMSMINSPMMQQMLQSPAMQQVCEGPLVCSASVDVHDLYLPQASD